MPIRLTERIVEPMHRFAPSPGRLSRLARWIIATLLLAGNLTMVPPGGLHAEEAKPKAKIRNVTPDSIPVIILPPRDELGASSPVLALPDLEPPVRARVQSDGTLRVAGQRWQLAGILGMSSEGLCVTASGERWACGVRAFVAMRGLLEGQDLRCSQIATRDTDPVVRCSKAGADVSQVLLQEGWALRDETQPNERYDQALHQSQKAGRGIWQKGSKPVLGDAALRTSGSQ